MTKSGANAHFWGIKMCPRCYMEYCKVFTKHTKLHFAMDLNSTKLTSLETTGRMLPY